jgi:hypothetical protein
MPYNANIPQPGDIPAQSQSQLLANFTEIYNLIGVNHVNFGAAGEGKHNYVTMPVQGATPVTAAGELALFSQISAISGLPAMAWVQQSAGTVVEFSTSGNLVSGWFRTVSNILVKWGQATGTGIFTFNYPVIDGLGQTIPPFVTNVANVQTTPVGITDIFSAFDSTTLLALTVNCTARTNTAPVAVTFNWLAIGQ